MIRKFTPQILPRCPNCKHSNFLTSSHCDKCGRPLPSRENVAAAEALPKHKSENHRPDAVASAVGPRDRSASPTGTAPQIAIPVSGPRIFISYSHKDDKLREELDDHLQPLRRAGLVESWHDRKILPGDDWKKEIDQNLERADVVVLLVSVAFINSDFCYENEMARALTRHAEGTVRIVPVICKACTWQVTPLGRLQALPKDGVPLSQFPDRDAAWTDVVIGLRRVIDDLRAVRGLR